MKTLVLGLGNTILTDDGVGIHVIREAAAAYSSDDVTFAEASVGGLRLLDLLAGQDRVILVDAIQTPGVRPGDLHCLHPSDVRASLHAGSSHDLSLPDALALGRSLGLPLPRDENFTILAVEAEDVLTFGETCTEQVQAAIPALASKVLEELRRTAGEVQDDDGHASAAAVTGAQMERGRRHRQAEIGDPGLGRRAQKEDSGPASLASGSNRSEGGGVPP
ncbi:MAG TPA: hydrogenase maturation protease [Anaerolineae bacterium]|nr:hydrogenase maturation protease [Anaerolineae bacterium]